MPAEFEAGVFAREPFWHGAGAVVPDRDVLTKQEVIELCPVLGMQVSAYPSFAFRDGLYVPNENMMFLIREDGQIVGEVGRRYQIVQTFDKDGLGAFDWLEELLKTKEAIFHTAGTLENGRKVWLQCIAPESMHILGMEEEEHQGFVTFMNSFDGSMKMRAIVGVIRVGCLNTFNAALGSAARTFEFRHTIGIFAQLPEARKALGIAHRYWDDVRKFAEVAIQTTFNDTMFYQMLNELVPLPSLAKVDYDPELRGNKIKETYARKEREKLEDIWHTSPDLDHIRGTAYAAVNAVTAYVDHEMRNYNTKRSNAAERRMLRILTEPAFKDKGIAVISRLAGINLN